VLRVARSARPAGRLSSALQRLRRNRTALVALGVIAAILLLALLGPALNPNRFDALDWTAVAAPPGFAHGHWLGTDRLGRDLFVRTLQGARLSLGVGALATAVSLLIGIAYGAVSGYCGGHVDLVMMRVVEILGGLPLIFFVILMTVVFGRDAWLLFIAIGAIGWLTMARIVRGQTLSVRRREFIAAAVAAGATPGRIIVRHIVPNVLGPVLVYAALTVPQIILFESFLSFLGLGVQEPGASLGTLIAEGAGEMESAPWMLLVPGGLLAALLLCCTVLGDGLRSALDAGDG